MCFSLAVQRSEKSDPAYSTLIVYLCDRGVCQNKLAALSRLCKRYPAPPKRERWRLETKAKTPKLSLYDYVCVSADRTWQVE
jgi:hypothetical protein